MSKASQPGTTEHPLTPEIRELISRYRTRSRWIMALGMASIILLLGALGQGFGLALLVGAISIAIAAPIWVLMFELPLAHDLRAGVCLRTAGPFKLQYSGSGYSVWIADRCVNVGVPLERRLRGLPWAVIDHSKYAHLIIEVRTRAGETLYAPKGYQR
jgi:hypothetical protein